MKNLKNLKNQKKRNFKNPNELARKRFLSTICTNMVEIISPVVKYVKEQFSYSINVFEIKLLVVIVVYKHSIMQFTNYNYNINFSFSLLISFNHANEFRDSQKHTHKHSPGFFLIYCSNTNYKIKK